MFLRLGLFRRSREVERLDFGLRSFGVDARAVPDAVKFTVVKLIKDATGQRVADEASCHIASELLAYCMMGDTTFATINDPDQVVSAQARIGDALAEPDGTDAQLILLSLHAGLIDPEVVERFEIAAD